MERRNLDKQLEKLIRKERALLEKVRQSFSQNGVEMTYNHLNVHLVGETKE